VEKEKPTRETLVEKMKPTRETLVEKMKPTRETLVEKMKPTREFDRADVSKQAKHSISPKASL